MDAKDEQTWEKNHQECIKINVIFCGLDNSHQENNQHDKQDERVESEGEGVQELVSQCPRYGR